MGSTVAPRAGSSGPPIWDVETTRRREVCAEHHEVAADELLAAAGAAVPGGRLAKGVSMLAHRPSPGSTA